MYTNFPLYPTSVLSNTDYPAQADNTDTVYAALINALKTEIQSCFTELGTLPKGGHASVKARIEALELQLKVIIDLMEYVTDDAAQLAYVSNDAAFVSNYPTSQNETYVKATSKVGTAYWQYYTTDPTKSLIGGQSGNQWIASTYTNQRFHIDLGSAKIVTRIYYENGHDNGGSTSFGVENFIFQGSNTAVGSFDDLVYANDEGWTSLTCSQNTLDQHVSANQADPKYITVTNSTAYRYYAFKFADNYAGATTMCVRRIVLQTKGPLQCYTNNTIPRQGTYCLKVIAAKTDSLNDTLIKTISPVKDLSGKASVTIWARSDRTGENLKLEYHDSGGETIEYTIKILVIDTWEEKQIDISAVDNDDKNTIDQIKYTILNADADTEFYLDDNIAP